MILRILGTPLLNQVNVDTTGDAVSVLSKSAHTIAVQAANFGGGTVTIEWSLDGDTWSQLLDNASQPLSFTQNTVKAGLTFIGIYIRARLYGSTGAQGVNAIFCG